MCPFCWTAMVMATAGVASTSTLGFVLVRVVRGRAAMDEESQEPYSQEGRRANDDQRN
jgi:hypothetical protein